MFEVLHSIVSFLYRSHVSNTFGALVLGAAFRFLLKLCRDVVHLRSLRSGVLLWFFVLLLVRGHSHHDTQDVIMHEFPLLVAIPLLVVLVVVLFVFLFWFVAGSLSVVLFVGFACCFCGFWFCCWDCILDCVQVHCQYFCDYRQLTSLHDYLNSSFASIEHV